MRAIYARGKEISLMMQKAPIPVECANNGQSFWSNTMISFEFKRARLVRHWRPYVQVRTQDTVAVGLSCIKKLQRRPSNYRRFPGLFLSNHSCGVPDDAETDLKSIIIITNQK